MFAKRRLFAKVAALVTVIYPHVVVANDFTASNVLSWNETSQDTFFRTSIVMTSIMAMQGVPSQRVIAECIFDWYGSEELQTQRHDQIRGVLENYPENHPQGIILAVIEKACGQFEGS